MSMTLNLNQDTTATVMPIVQTQKEVSRANVELDSMEMESHAMVEFRN